MSSRRAPSRKRRQAPGSSEASDNGQAAPSTGQSRSAQPTTPEPTTTQLQRFFAELLGTFLLVLFHGGAAASLLIFEQTAAVPTPKILGVAFLALLDGFSLFIIIMIVGKISGVLINPAVTIGLTIRGRFPPREVPLYLAAQFAGATLGALMILAAMGRIALTVGHLGAVKLAPGVSVWQGMLVEALGAFFLVLTINATAEDPRSPSGWAAFAIGMSLTASVFVFEPLTGSPVNPARAFGPNLVGALLGAPVNWGDYLLCYLLGPIIGASIASAIYYYVAKPPPGKPAPEPG